MFYEAGNVAGVLAAPRGILLHSTRSGREWNEWEEFQATVGYVKRGAAGLGWSASIGPDIVCTHMSTSEWGWNSRSASPNYIAIEFSQARIDRYISDAQVVAAGWWIRHRVLVDWPRLPLYFPSHAEVETYGETGKRDGKTDPYPVGDPRMEELRARLRAAIG